MTLLVGFVTGFALATLLLRLEFRTVNNARGYYDLAMRLSEIYDKYFNVMDIEDLIDIDTAKVRLAWGIPQDAEEASDGS